MRKILVVTLLLLAAALPLAAQSLTGTVTGVVKDEQGGVLPGVTVTLTGKTGSRTQVTDAQGVYRFAGVDPGTFSVSAEISGFRPKRQDNVLVSIARVADVRLTLAVGGKTETVDVVGEAPIVDSSSSSTDNSLSQDMLFNLPIRPTNAATDMLNYLPGINNGSSFGTNSGYANGLLIDGVDTRDPEAGSSWVFFNYNLMEEVQVGGLGANAEYGSYTGAVVNTLMKSGGNHYTGLFDAYWTKDSFWADNVSAENIARNAALKDPAVVNKRLDLSGQIGGPLIQDKLFFFVAAQRYEQKDNPSGPLQAHTEVSPRFNGKLTWQPNNKDKFTAGFQWDYYNQTGRCTVSAGLCTDQAPDNLAVKQDSPEAVWGLQWTHLFGNNRTFSEVKYSGWWGYYYLDPAQASPASYDLTSGEWSGGGLYHYYADRGRQQVNVSISHFAETFGKHDLKFGLEIERSKVHNRFGYTGGGYYYDYTELYDGGHYLLYDYSYDSDGRNNRESVYAQDSWKPTDRLTINAGIRVDFVRGKSPVLDKTVYDNTNWAPRFGFAFDATGDGKTVVKGSYGQYYEAVLSDQYVRAMPGYTDFIGYSWDPSGDKCMAGGNCFSESSRLPYPVYAVDPEMKHPRVDEWTAGFDRALGADLRVSVTGIYRQDENVQASVYPDARWTPTTLDNGLTNQPLTVYNWSNRSASELTPMLTNVDGFVYRDVNGNPIGSAGAQRRYQGLMFVLDKRFSNRWQGRISYVLSKTESTIDNTGSATYGQTSAFETPTNALVNSDGRPVNDRPHEVKLYATWQIPKIEIGLNAYYRYLSGRTWTPFQRFTSRQISYPVSSGRQPFLEPFGDHRLGSESYLDLRIEKIFRIGQGSDRFAVYGDLQNLLNSGTVIAVNTRYPDVTISGFGKVAFGGPTAITQPRRFILGARWSF